MKFMVFIFIEHSSIVGLISFLGEKMKKIQPPHEVITETITKDCLSLGEKYSKMKEKYVGSPVQRMELLEEAERIILARVKLSFEYLLKSTPDDKLEWVNLKLKRMKNEDKVQVLIEPNLVKLKKRQKAFEKQNSEPKGFAGMQSSSTGTGTVPFI